MGGEHEARRARVAGAFASYGVDALLVTSLVNVLYLTGFTGSNAALLLTPDAAVLATDGRYDAQARRETSLSDIRITRDLTQVLVNGARPLGVLGIEAEHMTLAEFDVVAKAAGSGITLAARSGIVEKVRRCKDEAEITAISTAAAIADAAFASVVAELTPGTTERAMARALDDAMRAGGAEDPAFATIVAAGLNGAEPHHVPTDYPIALGDLVTIDMGARVAGYRSDMTRTVACGDPSPRQRDLHTLVLRAHEAGRAAVRPGVTASEVDRAARDVIEAAGHGEHFVHGLGHGVGLQIHEAPMLTAADATELEPGMVITVEPGVYVPGRGGARIEDTLVVTPDGSRLLTSARYGL